VRGDVVALTTALVACDSQNPGPGEAAVVDLILDRVARPAGFEATRVEAYPGRPNLLLTVDRGPGPHLVLSGHVDTKPVGDALGRWSHPPLELTVVDGMAYGLGSSDMKGPVAAMLLALEAFARTPGRGRASVLLTADEETTSAAGAVALAARGVPQCDAIVIGEPSGVTRAWESIAVVSRGIACFEIHVTARQGHSGLSASLGRNAIQLAAEVVLAFDGWAPPVARPGPVPCEPTVNPGMTVSGGVAFGTWPGAAVVGCEIRLVPGMDRAGVMSSVEELARRTVGDRGQVEVRPVADSRAWAPAVATDPSARVVRVAQEACAAVLGAAPALGAYPGTTEATHFAPALEVPVVASLGPGWLSVAHGPDECVAVADLEHAVAIYARMLASFCSEDTATAPQS